MAKQQKRKTDWEKKHQRNVSRYQREIEALYEEAAKQAALVGGTVGVLAADTAFSFDSQPALRKRAEKLLSGLYSGVYAVIVDGIKAEWTLANNKNNELSRVVFGDNIGKLTKEQYARYFSTTGNACDAFIRRKVSGLNLSDRVWNYTNQFKGEIETVLDIGIHSGHSADVLSQDLREFLKYPDKLFRRVRTGVDENGEPIYKLSKAAEQFHPGQGVYRSSYKNARRLAATETNIAYRTADYDRWQEMDFIVGIKICLSNNHTLNGKPFSDICDELQGKYPKDFKFTGWHPHCRCHVETIMKTREELDEDFERMLRGEEPTQGSVNEVKDMPDNFKQWVARNDGRIARAEKKGTLPYFLQDNPKALDEAKGIAAKHREFLKYESNPDYKDAKFDWSSGGYKATHVGHKTHPNDTKTYFAEGLTGDQLENEFMEKAFSLGHRVIFKAEAEGVTDLDMFLDGELMDLVSVTENSTTFLGQLKRKNKQLIKYNALHDEENQSVCMYFHDPAYYSYEKVWEGLKNLRKFGTDIQIKTVYILTNDGSDIIRLYFP